MPVYSRPIPWDKIAEGGEGASSPIFPEREGASLYTGYKCHSIIVQSMDMEVRVRAYKFQKLVDYFIFKTKTSFPISS